MSYGVRPPLTAEYIAEELGLTRAEPYKGTGKFIELSDRIRSLSLSEQNLLKASFLARYAPQALQSYRLALREFSTVTDIPRLLFFARWIENSHVLLQTLFNMDPTLLPEPEETMQGMVEMIRVISSNPNISGRGADQQHAINLVDVVLNVGRILRLYEAFRYRRTCNSPLISQPPSVKFQVDTFTTLFLKLMEKMRRNLGPGPAAGEIDWLIDFLTGVVSGKKVEMYRDCCFYEKNEEMNCLLDNVPKGCARCRTVAYCSPAHQKLHWKDARAPHKSLCIAPTWLPK